MGNMTARRWLLVVGAVAATLAVVVGPATAAGKPQTISVLAIDTFTGIEGYTPGSATMPTIGSGYVGYGTVYKWAGLRRGARIGSIRILCTFTSAGVDPSASSMFCNTTLFLPRGQLEFSRFTSQAPVVDLPVVGGTGAYAHACGYVRVDRIGVNKFADTLHLMIMM
jgi:hypothetical protein